MPTARAESLAPIATAPAAPTLAAAPDAALTDAPDAPPVMPPTSAADALHRADAAYDSGDIRAMIDLARRVAEGALAGNDDQRATALRLLGIGLYLDGRPDGAERAFTELLTLRPKTTLDPATTRADAVAFFNDVRRRRQPRQHFALVFLPPAGQFQNDTPKRGWLLGGLELATLGTAVTTRILLGNWRRDSDGLCTVSQSTCDNLKLANTISVAAFATTWLVGVIDAWLNYDDNSAPPSDQPSRASSARPRNGAAAPRPTLVLLPSGAALHLRF